MSDSLLEQLRALEITLHQPDIRKNQAELEAILHPNFQEIGRSGTIYTKQDTIDSLSTVTTPITIWSDHYQLHRIDAHTVQLIYQSARVAENGKKSRWTWRSSLWIKSKKGWQLRFHQGTAVGSPPSESN